MLDWMLLLGFVFIPALVAVGAHELFRRIVPADSLIPHHDVAGFLISIVGVLYAIVLGFVVITVWTSFDSAQRSADLEAGDVGDAFGYATILPDPQRSRMERALARYAVEVHDVEWNLLRHDTEDPKARADLQDALHALTDTPVPSTAIGDALRVQSDRNRAFLTLLDVYDKRRSRLIEAGQHLERVMWLALIMGGLALMVFVFLFGVSNRWLQLTMTALVSGCIGMLLGVVVVFNSPYSGALRINADAWNYIIDHNDMRQLSR